MKFLFEYRSVFLDFKIFTKNFFFWNLKIDGNLSKRLVFNSLSKHFLSCVFNFNSYHIFIISVDSLLVIILIQFLVKIVLFDRLLFQFRVFTYTSFFTLPPRILNLKSTKILIFLTSSSSGIMGKFRYF